jgi:cbb3-type cytochrome oxidase subunit 3
MSLPDVVGHAGLSSFAEIALVLFFGTFLGILAYVVLRRRGAWDRARRLPLDDEVPAERHSEESDR